MNVANTETGLKSEKSAADSIGLRNLAALRWNDDEKTLFDLALGSKEGIQTAKGSLAVQTGNTPAVPLLTNILCEI